jgi:hypothetical protein
MKKITIVHAAVILAVILSFIALMFFANSADAAQPKQGSYAARQELKKVRRAVDKQTKANKQAKIQERRSRIQYNGNINNFYPRAFKVRWIIINNRAYLMFSHYDPYYGYYQRYMRIT